MKTEADASECVYILQHQCSSVCAVCRLLVSFRGCHLTPPPSTAFMSDMTRIACVCVVDCACCDNLRVLQKWLHPGPAQHYTRSHHTIWPSSPVFALRLLDTSIRSPQNESRRQHRPPRHGRPRPVRGRLATAACRPGRRPFSSSPHTEPGAHNVFRPSRQHQQPQSLLGLQRSPSP